MKKQQLFFAIHLLFLQFAFAQQGSLPFKWGKISQKEANLTTCSYDSTASAILLGSLGTAKIIYGSGSVGIEKHYRVKILNKKGLAYADVSIPYYAKDNYEKISNVKAQTINIDQKGNPVKNKVDNSAIIKEDAGNGWKQLKINFPSVQEGSIIEYKYTIHSQNFTSIEGWTFDRELPVLHSEFRMIISEGFQYNILYQGDKITKKYGEGITNKWVLTDLPALQAVPFVANHENYANKIRFQLASYRGYTDEVKQEVGTNQVLTNWNKLASEVLNHQYYFQYFNKSLFAKEILASLPLKQGNDLENIQTVYNYVKNSLKWNGQWGILPRTPIKEVWEKKMGNSVEINALLTLLLQKSGLEANPVFLSTPEHGAVLKEAPFIEQFNHTICNVRIGEKDYLLDKKKPRWISVNRKKSSQHYFNINLKWQSEALPIYTVESTSNGYTALHQRHAAKEQGEEGLLKSLLSKKITTYETSDFDLESLHETDDKLILKTNLLTQEGILEAENRKYVRVYFGNDLEENPFKHSQRFLPVEMPYPTNQTYRFSMEIPKDWKVEEIPKNVILKMPKDFGQFSYKATNDGQNVSIIAVTRWNSGSIPPNYYLVLKEFYDQMIAKLQEQIVLKKEE